jgi:type III secretion protein SpaR/YscT/HrcT
MFENYVTMYLNSGYGAGPPISLISLLLLSLARILPILLLASFFGAKLLPHPVKVALGLSLFAILMPHIVLRFTKPLEYNVMMIFYVLKELLVGTLIGFLVSIPFFIVQGSGVMIDHQRGAASLMVNDPTTQNQASPLGTLYNYILIFIFYYIGGPFEVIEALIRSYDIIPADQFLSPAFFSDNAPAWKVIMGLLNKTMALIIQLSAPSLIAILMTDSFLGIINRLAPQVQISFLGMGLKSLLGVALVFFGWKVLLEQMSKETMTWMRDVNTFISYFASGP